ncbi:FecR family protein [Dyadobacter sp. CY323]|uniref:FecR family protein n=1 Tax=Dyadobacter sp. CY323 TaxID=2907302 RepID=UPI001F29EF55|nr:FecR domain-containing protein [Dyadobacter sp. CY323]MCE6990344.1 FecR domain-containing protein [Dyadobacter sp. CY323]
MNTHDNISEELLARYLADNASEKEIATVLSWLAESPLHEKEFAAYKLIWEHSGAIGKSFRVDTDMAWGKMKSKMDKSSAKISLPGPEVKQIPFGKKAWPVPMWAAAAVTLLLVAFSWYFLNSGRFPEPLLVATSNNTVEKILPDGTKVFLNYNSSISYPEEFNGDLRTVSLKGEAFFDVKPDAEHPFIIDADGTEIKVLGTSFNVKAYKESPVRVDVSTGKVQVSKASHKVQLTKGEGAEVLADSIRSLKADVNIMGYRTQIYDFNAANLTEVINSIRDGYHVDVRLSNEQIAQCRLTIRFEKEPLDATLSVIAETLNLDLKKEGKVYWLDGNGCQ